jgi:hypothetical protein
MNGIFRLLIVFGMGIFGRVAFRWFLTGAPTVTRSADQGDAPAGGFAQTQVAPLLEKVLGEHISPAQAGVVVAGTLVFAVGVGLVARLVLGERVFGARLNGVIALLGAWAAVGLYAAVAGQGSPDQIEWVVGFAGCGAVLALAAAAVLKAFVAGEFDAFMTGGQTRIGSAMRRVGAASPRSLPSEARLRAAAPPRGPSAERLRAAVSRANP